MIWLLIKYILSAALKDRVLLAFLVLVTVGVSLSIFLGSAAVTEKDQFVAVFSASALRFSSVFTLILFCVFYVRKTFDLREVEFMLTRPVTRFQYLTAHSVSFSLVALALSLVCFFIIFFVAGEAGSLGGVTLWGVSLFIELAIVAHVALFFSFALQSAVSASLMTIAFYTLSRMIGGVLGVVSAEVGASGTQILMEKLMLLISVVVPRLDLMAQGEWNYYGANYIENFLFVLGQAFVFLGLIFSATLIDFKRKQFK